MCYYSSGGRNLLFLTDIPLHRKPCYKMLLTSLNNFVLIVRIAIKLVFPDRIYNVFLIKDTLYLFLQGFSDQFDKYSWSFLDDLGVSYDYQSIMHYDRLAFTKNGRPTIVAIGNENMKFRSPDFKLSARDAVEINALYDCHNSKD